MSPEGNNHASQDHFDLLPFISIMLCLLGTLLLVTMSMAAISLGAGAGEGWIPEPGQASAGKTPILVEWDGTTAVWHKGQALVRIQAAGQTEFIQLGGTWFHIRRGEGKELNLELLNGAPPRGPLDDLLDELAAKHATHYALFAVRPSGFDSFPRFSAQFRARNIDIGYEPIEQTKPVRLMPPKPEVVAQ